MITAGMKDLEIIKEILIKLNDITATVTLTGTVLTMQSGSQINKNDYIVEQQFAEAVKLCRSYGRTLQEVVDAGLILGCQELVEVGILRVIPELKEDIQYEIFQTKFGSIAAEYDHVIYVTKSL